MGEIENMFYIWLNNTIRTHVLSRGFRRENHGFANTKLFLL
jgi:hypothetical protein